MNPINFRRLAWAGFAAGVLAASCVAATAIAVLNLGGC